MAAATIANDPQTVGTTSATADVTITNSGSHPFTNQITTNTSNYNSPINIEVTGTGQ